MNKLLTACQRHRRILLYGIFGVLTIIVNIAIFFLTKNIFSTVISNIIAWIFAVLFAYVTNRIWVFESGTKKIIEIIREMGAFFGCRLTTGIIDTIFMYVTVDMLDSDAAIMKVLSNIIVIILNYVASKKLIFVKKEKDDELK